DRLTPDGRGARSRRGGPGCPAVGGPAHLQRVALEEVVPLDVTVAVEGAGGGRVAGDPFLVVERTAPTLGHRHRRLPSEAPVEGSAGQDGLAGRACDRQAGD